MHRKPFSFRRFPSLILPLLLALAATPSTAGAPADSELATTDRAQEMHQHLQELDRALRHRRQQIEGMLAHGRQDVGDWQREVAGLRRHLRNLEATLHGWGPGEAERLRAKVRALEPLVKSLERAAAGRMDGAGSGEAPRPTAPSPSLQAVPVNDDCADALPMGLESVAGETTEATADGASCYGGSPDVWYRYSSTAEGDVYTDTQGSEYDTVLSVHTGCPGTSANQIACNDDVSGGHSAVGFHAEAGADYFIRVAGCCGAGGSTGAFSLHVQQGGGIAGTVTDAVTGEPIPAVRVTLSNSSSFDQWSALTGPDGEYAVSGLGPGTYFAAIDDPRGYLWEIYDDLPCELYGCDSTQGTPIEVVSGGTASGIDFALNRGGTISGTVTAAASGQPLPSVAIRVWNSDGNEIDSRFTNASGEYSIDGLYAGTYAVTAEKSEYLAELYDDIPCPGGGGDGCDPRDGAPVEVGFGATTADIDFALERLGTISGTVTEAGTGFPIAFSELGVWNQEGSRVAYGQTDASGFYIAGGLVAGTYFVRTDNYSQYFDELYDDLPCEPECDPTTGTPIAIELNGSAENVDFVLDRLGGISGTVTHTVTGEPIAGVDVFLHSENGWTDATFTNSVGRYTFSDLAPDNHFLIADHSWYRSELYDDLPCPDFDCEPADGTPVAVALGAITGGIDFDLDRLGTVTGRVTHAVTGQPIESVLVRVRTESGSFSRSDVTDSSGRYTVNGLVPGSYVAIASHSEYQDELYDDLPCDDELCDLGAGTPIAVSLNGVTADLDFALERLGSIAGRVTNASTGQAVSDARVRIYDPAGAFAGIGFTGFAGDYAVSGLAPGDYTAIVSHHDYQDELYDDFPCAGGGCDPRDGEPITTDLNTITGGVDFALERLGAISGRVTRAATGQPDDNAEVEVYNVAGNPVAYSFVDAAGFYLVEGLAPGIHYAVARHYDLPDELYRDIPCDAGCDPRTGTPIAVSLNVTTTEIDFTLGPTGPCAPTSTSVCLAGDRFRVEARWRDFEGNTGPGVAESLTADTGIFWFFDPGNVELILKVLDACVEPFNHFWVFGGGLTNLETEITVTDEASGEVWTSFNPLGSAFQPVQDTFAFATCDAGSAAAARRPEDAEGIARRATRELDWTPGGDKSCTPSATDLCLSDGRFAIEVLWQTNDGDSGTASAIQLTSDTGYFWFFGPDNVEVIVKVLDACGLTGFENFWVFAAGLTDVEALLRVTDTESGEVQEYLNPLGTAFQPIQDTGSFTTCP